MVHRKKFAGKGTQEKVHRKRSTGKRFAGEDQWENLFRKRFAEKVHGKRSTGKGLQDKIHRKRSLENVHGRKGHRIRSMGNDAQEKV